MSFDVESVTSAITAGGAAVATIGAAMLIMVIGVKIWKKLRGAA